ncbi:HYR domain-containing protein [Neolewinella aurantiaca]|uniref:HYR domain-containing protein n=1 Tax=Neolewinella aurantiaca TaxID=2602767 RepID=A0A5C7FDQ7_9BACT|nr:HYR domain-containing protein [Neolewinella aurantiaca]TXF89150.1 HYR domain-containing protein [Neolewinella aurantiaca]
MTTQQLFTSLKREVGRLVCSRRFALCLLLYVMCSSTGGLQAQCTFEEAFLSGEERSLADYDGTCNFVVGVGCTYPAPGTTSLSRAITTGLPPATEVTSPMVINICFSGDIDVEYLEVDISGRTFYIGNLGYIPDNISFNSYCRDFVLYASTVESDLADSDIDITVAPYLPTGGWTPDPNSDGSDNYGFEIVTINFEYNFDVDITPAAPTDDPTTSEDESVMVRCSDDADIDFDSSFPGASFTINPVPATGFDTNTGLLDVSEIPAGLYSINATFTSDDNFCSVSSDIVQVSVLAEAVASLKPTLINCAAEMDSINLSVMFDGANLEGGTFSVVSGPAATINDNFLLIPPGGGCLGIQYSVVDAACNNVTRTSNTAELLILMEPSPEFTVGGYTSPICNAGGNEIITLSNISNGPNQSLTILSSSGTVNGAPATNAIAVAFGSVSLSGPAASGSNTYTICLTEENSPPTSCASAFPSDDASTPNTDESQISTCAETTCSTVVIYNDGNGCAPNALFANECEPDPDATDVCEVDVKNNLALSCSFFTLNGPQLIEAELENYPGLIQCSDPAIDFDWQGSLPGSFGDIATGGPTLGDLNPAAGVICDIITFEICIPLPIVDDICIDPIPLGSFEDACDQTIGQIIFTNLGALIGGDGGSGIVVADTDGDGNFDYIVEDYVFPASGSASVPNNIVSNTGTITIRNVTSWPFDAADVCGEVTSESINLLELLPIGAIPLVGIIIEDLLAAASCNVDLVFSDEETIEIPVYNNSVPEFANCPENGYVITEDGVCDTEVSWSVPVAYDGCGGDALQYKGFTDYPEATMYYNGPSTPTPVAVASSGVYQTAGPLPGSDLEPGTYTVAYSAYSCSGIVGTCSFEVLVTSGDPVLACPDDVALKVDGDVCTTVVTGIAPLQGLNCATVINYSIAFADGTTAETTTPYSLATRGTHNDVSGIEFPFGTSTVTYTMLVDINGDNIIADDGSETQTCDFDVQIVDVQRPEAVCVDIDVRLDNTGNVTVFAEDQMDDTAFINGGSTDNCGIESILIAKPNEMPSASTMFDCTETGYNLVTLSVTDNSGNVTTCLSQIKVDDFFEGISFDLDAPEICLEANNPSQLDFSNYLVVTLPDGTTLSHAEVANNTYLGDAVGGFGITAFAPAAGSASANPGSISTDGVYTPGDGTGFVTVSYVLALPGAVMQNGNVALTGCVEIAHATFELRQPLDMDSPECECIVQNDRVVNLGEVTGGLEPYTIQFSGVHLDVDNDQIADDVNGSFTYQGSYIGSNGAVINYDNEDFTEDLGNLLVDYTQPTWSFTVIDARGCEIFRSGSCDNDDENGTPEILCENLGPVALFTEPLACEAQYLWAHTLPTDNCDVILYTYTITNPDGSVAGPFDITALLNPDITNPLPDQFNGSYDFEHVSPTQKTSTVTYYAEDAVGNFSQCSFEVTVTDDDPPRFINCPEPAVIVDAPDTWCSAFANYSLPLAEDNCSIPVVTQVDDTGLTSGDLYPVGITINTFEAVDPTGNTVRCDVKIIVNDFHTPPTYDCPDDVNVSTDAGDCVAVVDNIAPTNIEDNCLPNLTVVYRIDDADGNEVASGFDDASGNSFGLGSNTVSYSVQDMPLLLITEITHDLSDAVDGTLPVPGFTTGNPADGDYLEITNFNRAALDVSCLMITRSHAAGLEEYAVPTFTILQPGGTLTIHFGDGTNSPADDFFNVPGAANLAADEPAAYSIGLSRSVIDVAIMNGFDISGTDAGNYWSGTTGPVNGSGIVRTTVWDTNTAADFAPGEACLPTTIGALNPGLEQPTPNGASTAIQAQPTVRVECDFTVTVSDDEAPVCGLYGEWNSYSSGAIDLAYGECVEAVYTVGEAYTVSDVNLNIQGLAGDMGNLTFTLISPEGTEVVLAAAVCAGTDAVEFTFDGDFGPSISAGCGFLNNAGELIMPVGDIEIFNGEAAAGDWTLEIGHNAQVNTAPASFASSILFVSSREVYPDYTTTLENDFRLCGAEYTWNHAILFDNCEGGSILWTIIDSSGTTLASQPIPIFPENTEVTFFFPVGVSTVNYALTDGNGNTSNCSFDVTVNDTEAPVITCPADATIQLSGGECERAYRPTDYTATDNCAVVDIFGTPPFNQPLPIGDNTIEFTVVDAAGNDTTCTYVVTILEYIPANPQMACLDQINIHLDGDCEQEIIPALVLAGNEYYCFDNYVLTLLQQNETGSFDTITPNIAGIDQIGEVVRYQVYDPRNDVSCWGNIDVGFFEAPEFICPSDTTVSCNAATDTSLLGVPILQSCAIAGATIAFADTLQRNDACDDPRAILRRTWTVTDAYGNSASCVQTVTIEAFDLAVVRFPANRDGDASPAIYCAAAAADPTLTDPENTGFPFVDDGSDIFTTNFCSASYLYSDEVFNICAGSYEILRTWKVRNTCQPVVPGVNPIEAVQIIRVLDFENPALECPDDVTISTSSIDCNGAYLIPEPVVETGCTNWEYTVSASNGELSQLHNGTYLLSGLDEGGYTIRYEVEDECGRYSECIFNLTVVDQVGPTAACEDGLNVSLDGNGLAIVSTADIDGNSEDLCGEVELAIRRLYELDPGSCQAVTPYYTDWDASIGLNCCDLQDLVTVELRVTDEDGNSSVCWTEILVEDKIAPTCLPPEDVTITCVEYSNNLPNDIADATEAQLNAMFGTAGGADNCSFGITQMITGSTNNCGVGQLTRIFTVTDGGGLTNNVQCTQQISIVPVFDYQITFPTDESGTCAEIPDYDDLAFTDFGCDLLTVTTAIDTLRTTEAGEECFKLRITYDAVNWCEYNSLGEPYLLPRDGNNGRDPETELLYLNVKPGTDVNITSDDFAFLSRFTDRIFNANTQQADKLVDDGNDVAGTNDGNGENDAFAYAQDDSRGAFRYVQFIKVYDEVAPVIVVDEPAECFSGNGDNCAAEVTLSFTATDDCSDAQVTAQLDLDFNETAGFVSTRQLTPAELTIDVTGTYIIRLNEAPVGAHAILINANDGCGNSENVILEFCVDPVLAPTPICVQTLTVTLSDDGNGGGAAAIWASDFIASPITDCFGNEIDSYSLYSEAEASTFGFIAEEDQLGITLTCTELEEIGSSGYPVRVYAFDAAGNNDYCTVFVEIQEGSTSPCEFGELLGHLAGVIVDGEMNPIEGVTVNLTGPTGMNTDLTTPAEGTFTFSGLPLGQDYTISPTHFEDYGNGVRTSDIVAVTRHILSTQSLPNVFSMLAADVDGNTSIDVGDIISIRRLILGLSDAFPAGMPSWMFIPADYDFPAALDPWSAEFPNVSNYNNLVGTIADADFIGVKLGDVNQSAQPNSLVSGAPRNLNGTLEFEINEAELLRGQTYLVPVYASALDEVDGYQFTLRFNPSVLEVTSIEPGLVAAGNFGWNFADQGLITTSWNWASGNVASDWQADEVLFTLNVQANANGKISEGLEINSRYTHAEAYERDSGNLRNLALVFNEDALSVGTNELLQNVPNPVRNQTLIGFRLATAHPEVVVSVRDAAGRLVGEFKQEGLAGSNSLVIDNRLLGTPAGVYSYTVKAGDWVATKRMIILR